MACPDVDCPGHPRPRMDTILAMIITKFRKSLIATLMAIAVLLPAAPAGAAANVQLVNAHSHLCLSPAGGSTGVNVVVVQYYCDRDTSRLWSYPPFPGGGSYIRNLHSGLCLSPAGGSAGLNVSLVQYYCDANPARNWTFTYKTPDTSYMYNQASHLCASPAGGSTGLNVVIVQYFCDTDFARGWHE